MSLVLIVSILIRLVALVWTILMMRRQREWRIGFFSLILALMATRQILTLVTESDSWQISITDHATEFPGLVVSVMALLAILFLDRVLTDHRRTEQALRASREWFRKRDERAARDTEITLEQFRRRFIAGLVAAWLIPPATGELGMCFLGFWDLRQAGLSLVRFTGFYIIGFTIFAYFVFKRGAIQPVTALGDPKRKLDLADATKLRAFPWVFWSLLTVYCSCGPATVMLSNATFENVEYTFEQYAFAAFGVIPFLLVAAFPMFFYLTDLMGRFLAPRGVMIVVAPLWLKMTVLGLFTPVMIDTILLIYYFNRTSFIAVETIILWFVLVLIAGAGTLLVFRSCRQGLTSLKQPLSGGDDAGSDDYPVPRSLDEFGLLAQGWADLLGARNQAQREVHELNLSLEQRVAQRTADFEEKNAELEAFAHSVAHDLRAPLRAMHGFSEAILEDYGQCLDDGGRGFAQRIVDASTRMDGMIQDLLDYSRIGRDELHLTPVNLTVVVQESLAQLEQEVHVQQARVTVDDPLSSVIGHRATLVQIITNLLTNAIKFTTKDVPPEVRVWSEASDGKVRLWVEDNGIGIAEEHLTRIFRVFERLHGMETYSGTGIGLAIVRRATERLGGKVGLESAPGEGSKFWVELSTSESN